jgi:hypothetical protein
MLYDFQDPCFDRRAYTRAQRLAQGAKLLFASEHGRSGLLDDHLAEQIAEQPYIPAERCPNIFSYHRAH